MPASIPVGPCTSLIAHDGVPFPYYVIPFDADGRSEGPLTQQHLLDHLEGVTDIFLFSHGWNNDWTVATERYEGFIKGYQALATKKDASPRDYKPLLIGIFWPSQAMEWFESETGPKMAGGDQNNESVELTRNVLEDIAADLPAPQRARFFELSQTPTLEREQAAELAAMLAALTEGDGEAIRPDAATPEDLLAAAAQFTATTAEPDYHAIGTTTDQTAAPEAAGIAQFLDPRNLIKPFTVWQMKDRAGKVGTKGTGPLLTEILKRSTARINLLGHSFGCKVVMSALCATPEDARPVHSALLLQPAFSQYAFASRVPERGVPGGYCTTIKKVTVAIAASFSARDVPLTRFFHWAVRRHADLGELPDYAGISQSLYGALGGFGPQASDAQVVNIKDAFDEYDWGKRGRLVGIDGTRTISGHGDISNSSTWWLAHSLASQP